MISEGWERSGLRVIARGVSKRQGVDLSKVQCCSESIGSRNEEDF